jgi:hypothetical protein
LFIISSYLSYPATFISTASYAPLLLDKLALASILQILSSFVSIAQTQSFYHLPTTLTHFHIDIQDLITLSIVLLPITNTSSKLS